VLVCVLVCVLGRVCGVCVCVCVCIVCVCVCVCRCASLNMNMLNPIKQLPINSELVAQSYDENKIQYCKKSNFPKK